MTTPLNTFKSFYENLPANQQNDFKDAVCNLCGFSLPTFYRRLRENEDLFTPVEKKAIAEYAGVTVQTIFGTNPSLKIA